MYIYPKPKIVDYNDDVFLIKENTYLYVDEEFENEDFFELLCEFGRISHSHKVNSR